MITTVLTVLVIFIGGVVLLVDLSRSYVTEIGFGPPPPRNVRLRRPPYDWEREA